MNRKFWLDRARREGLRFNVGWCLQLALPLVLGVGLATAVAILIVRTAGGDPRDVLPWAVLALAAVCVGSMIQARRRFLNRSEALARLDGDLNLHSRLVSAEAAVGEWPAPDPNAAFALRIRWLSALWPPAAALIIAAIAWIIPVPAGGQGRVAATAQPAAWREVDEKIEELKKDELIDQTAVEELRAQLEALRNQPPDQWYRHESLEAGDFLREQLTQALAGNREGLEKALGAIDAARQLEAGQMQAIRKDLDAALQSAAAALEGGRLPLTAEALNQLKNLDASKLRKLSTAEAKALSDKLCKSLGTCSNQGESAAGLAEKLLATIQTGSGGVARGPGSAPLTLSDKESRAEGGTREALSNDDLSRATLGELAGMGSGKHDVDPNAPVPNAPGGSMTSEGTGGATAFDQTTTPAEQEALRNFFK